MSKLFKKIDKNQMSIFDMLREYAAAAPGPTNGKFRVLENLRDAMRTAIKQCPLSRHQIAGEMSHLLDETITKEQIDSWTRENQMSDDGGQRAEIKRHIPAEYVPAFCQATKCNEPLKALGNPCGIFIMPGPEALRAEIQKLDEEIKAAQARKKKRMMFLKEAEGPQ